MAAERTARGAGGSPGWVRGAVWGALAGSLLLVTAPAVRAQAIDGTDPRVAYDYAVRAIQANKWDPALTAIDNVLKNWERRGLDEFGPVFGHFFYLKGMALVGKKNYAAAAKAFETCYKDYAAPAPTSRAKIPNMFRLHALAQWAGCLMTQGDFQTARKLYEKALTEDRRSGMDRAAAIINLGRCYLRTGDPEKGQTYLQGALAQPNLDPEKRTTIFWLLAEDWSPQADLATVRGFINRYRVIAGRAAPDDANLRLQRLAQQALDKDEPLRALLWFSLARYPGPILVELEAQAAEIAANPDVPDKRKEAAAEYLAAEQARLLKDYWLMLSGVGTVHYQLRNYPASFAVFDLLCREAGPLDQRPVFLYNVVASGAQLGRWQETHRWGNAFLKEYPAHPLQGAVARLLVETIFLQGDYAEAHRVASAVRRDMPTAAAVRDIPDFVVGAAAYHLNNYPEAETELEAYRKNYPAPQRLMHAVFYLGATKVKLHKWNEGARILDEFIEKWPQQRALLPSALYQDGLCKFMLENYPTALALATRLIEEFPQSPDVAAAWNLQGDIHAAQAAPPDKIEHCFRQARDLAARHPGQEEVAAYALWQLVVHAASAEQWQKMGTYFDEFRQQHATSAHRHDVLVAALDGLVKLNRTDETIAALRESVWQLGGEANSRELSQMVGSYLDFLQRHQPLEAVLAELQTQLARSKLPAPLDGWFRICEIESIENSGRKDQDAILQQKYRDLRARLNPDLASNYVIVRLARWLARTEKKPDDARQLYNFILEKRPGSADYDFALADTAELDAQSTHPDQRAAARDKFIRVLKETGREELNESATLGLARLASVDKQWPAAQARWEAYLENKLWSRSRPEANYELARSLDEQGQTDEALKIYVSVYVNFPGHLDWSTRAYIRTALILKERGKQLDALLVLRDMLQRMRHLDHPGVKEATELFTQWRADYKPEP